MSFLRGLRKHQLLLGALLLPALLYLSVIWNDYHQILRQSEQQARMTARLLEQHANNVFQTHKLIASLVNAHVRSMTWEEIAASRSLHDYLAGMVQEFPQVASLWLVDAAGNARNSSAVFPTPPVNVADLDYFSLRERDAGVFIGRLVHGPVVDADIFNVAQRRAANAAAFDGVVVVSARPGYFADFWNTVVGKRSLSILVREDGGIIARNPPRGQDLQPLPADSALRRNIQFSQAGTYRHTSPVDREDRVFAFEKLADFPVYVGHGVSLAAALAVWHRHVAIYGGFFAGSTLGLAWLALLAERRSRQQAAALAKVRETAKRLAEEVDYRNVVEAQLRQLQKTKAVGQLAGGMAHDFRNVLAVIIANLELLMLRHKGASDQDALGRARQVAERAATSIQSMLAFMRKTAVSSDLIDLNDVIRMDMLQQALGSAIRLILVPDQAACLVRVDLAQLEMAVLNLVFNARDAMMPQGGSLTLQTKIVTMDDVVSGLPTDYAALVVTDTGTGMPPEVLERVTTPFFTTKGEHGTGLGLSMVNAFVKQARGSISIDSEPGVGTSVTIYLPRALSSHRRAAAGTPARSEPVASAASQ